MINFIDTQEWVPIHTLPGFEAAIEYYVNKDGDILSTKGKEPKLKKHGKHSVHIFNKNASFISTSSGSNFHNDIFIIIRIFRN